MARQPKDDVKPINQAQLQSVLARLKHIHTSLETVAKDLKNDETLYVSYLPSLFRGLERLEAVEPQLRRSLAMHRAGSPLMPLETGKFELQGSPAKFTITSTPKRAKAQELASKLPGVNIVADEQRAESEAKAALDAAPPAVQNVGRKKKSSTPAVKSKTNTKRKQA